MRGGPGIALLRGINVGRAKRIAMADLRALFEALGFTEVRTVLNSGNVVFGGSPHSLGKVAAAIEEALGPGSASPRASPCLAQASCRW